MIESLMYAMIIIRLNLIYSLSILSRYCFNSNSTHVKIIIYVLKYIKETLNYDIHYEDKKNLMKYIDADFAKAMNNHRFINNYAFFLSKNLFS